MTKLIFRVKKVKKWTENEDTILKQNVNIDGRTKWKCISSLLIGKSSSDCFYRYRRLIQNQERRFWTKEEDNLLLSLIEKFGKSWCKIAKEMKTRNEKQIRDRYVNFYQRSINRNKFSLNEDILLMKLHRKYGNKWTYLVKFFEGRTADMLKNRYNSSIKNKKSLLSWLNTLDN